MCGSDGVSYDNVCFFQDSFCKNQSITIMAKGSCESKTSESQPGLGVKINLK